MICTKKYVVHKRTQDILQGVKNDKNLCCYFQLKSAADDTYTIDQRAYTIEQRAELAGFAVEFCTKKSPMTTTRCFVTLTSPLLRQSQVNNGSVDTGELWLYCVTCYVR